MAEGINRLMMVGNLVRDPKVEQRGQYNICSITIASNRKPKKQDAEEEVCFIDATLWGKDAEFVSQHYKKGDSLFLEGWLKMEKWVDKHTGQDRTKHVFGVERMVPTSKRTDYGSVPAEEYEDAYAIPTAEVKKPTAAPQLQQNRAQQATKQPPKTYQQPPQFDDNLPF